MVPTAGGEHRRPGRRPAGHGHLWRRTSLLLAGVGCLCLLAAGVDTSRAEPAARPTPHRVTPAATRRSEPPTRPAAASATPTAPSMPTRPPAPAVPAPPRVVRIPSIGVAAPVGSLGLNPDGTVEVPSDPDHAGWYRLGPTPGARGSSVILGHVDSTAGPAVFADLGGVSPGAVVAVGLDDGSTVRFRVRTVRVYPNADFPAQRVYGGRGRPSLDLVTCGGSYDAARGGYQANVVVHASLVR